MSDMTVINFPPALFGSLALLAALAFLLRDWQRPLAAAAALYSGGVALLLWTVDMSRPLWVLPALPVTVDMAAAAEVSGFTFALQTTIAPVMAVAFGLAALAFLLAVHTPQGETFVPVTLLFLIGLAALLLNVVAPVTPALLAPLFLAMLACLSAFALQAGRLRHPAGPVRVLIPPMIAFPLFLLAGWYANQVPLNPQDLSAMRTTATLLAAGLVVLLAPSPLHTAQPATAEASPPVVTAALSLLYQLAVLHLIFRTAAAFPFLPQQAPLAGWLNVAGIVTAVWGGVAAAGARHPGRLWGYAALHDWGLILMVLATPGTRSLPLALFLFILRAISMLTAAAGLSALEAHAGGLDEPRLNGAGARLPWSSAAFMLGGLGLAGFPLSAGFTGHWAALQIVAEGDWLPALIVLISSAGAAFGFIRLARTLFAPLENRLLLREGSWSVLLAAVALFFSVSLAVAPQLLNTSISRLLLSFAGV